MWVLVPPIDTKVADLAVFIQYTTNEIVTTDSFNCTLGNLKTILTIADAYFLQSMSSGQTATATV